jgi:hypothetical protein
LEEFVAAPIANDFLLDFRAAYGIELNLDPSNESSKPEPADGCAKPVGILGGRALQSRSIRA